MPIVTIADYNRNRNPRHSFTRQCPNFRTCWPGLLASYNPFVSSKSLALRRTAFLLVQLLNIIPLFLHNNVRTFVSLEHLPWTVAEISYFLFLAWNLHLIVDMEGHRTVFGKRFGRIWFDVFLSLLVPSYLSLVVLEWLKLARWDYLNSVWWVLLWLAIFAVAWVSTWTPDGVMVAVWDEEEA